MNRGSVSRGFVPVERADSTRHLDLDRMMTAPDMPDLRLSTESVTLRMPRSLVHNLKMLANRRDVPYQSLMKMLLSQAVERELRRKAA